MFTEHLLCAREQKPRKQAKPPAPSEMALRLWEIDYTEKEINKTRGTSNGDKCHREKTTTKKEANT